MVLVSSTGGTVMRHFSTYILILLIMHFTFISNLFLRETFISYFKFKKLIYITGILQ